MRNKTDRRWAWDLPWRPKPLRRRHREERRSSFSRSCEVSRLQANHTETRPDELHSKGETSRRDETTVAATVHKGQSSGACCKSCETKAWLALAEQFRSRGVVCNACSSCSDVVPRDEARDGNAARRLFEATYCQNCRRNAKFEDKKCESDANDFSSHSSFVCSLAGFAFV